MSHYHSNDKLLHKFLLLEHAETHTHVRERGNEVKLEMKARSHVLLLLHLTDFTNYKKPNACTQSNLKITRNLDAIRM